MEIDNLASVDSWVSVDNLVIVDNLVSVDNLVVDSLVSVDRLLFRDHYLDGYQTPLDVALSVDDGTPVSGFFKVKDTPKYPF